MARPDIAARHRAYWARTQLLDTVQVAAPQPDGTWSAPVTLAASVQQPRHDRSSPDRDEASERETASLAVYVLAGAAPVAAGWRVDWNGTTYLATGVAGDRTNPTLARIDVVVAQSAVAPSLVTFRRHAGSGGVLAWVEIGTFTVRVLPDPLVRTRTPGVVGGVVEAQTADGGVTTGVMLGGADLLPVEVGDWFTWRGVPGRVTGVDRDDPAHIELRFALETVVT